MNTEHTLAGRWAILAGFLSACSYEPYTLVNDDIFVSRMATTLCERAKECGLSLLTDDVGDNVVTGTYPPDAWTTEACINLTTIDIWDTMSYDWSWVYSNNERGMPRSISHYEEMSLDCECLYAYDAWDYDRTYPIVAPVVKNFCEEWY